MLVYIVLTVPASLVGVAVVIATTRAKQEDLPDIVRSLMRLRPRDDRRDDDGTQPPSLPKP